MRSQGASTARASEDHHWADPHNSTSAIDSRPKTARSCISVCTSGPELSRPSRTHYSTLSCIPIMPGHCESTTPMSRRQEVKSVHAIRLLPTSSPTRLDRPLTSKCQLRRTSLPMLPFWLLALTFVLLSVDGTAGQGQVTYGTAPFPTGIPNTFPQTYAGQPSGDFSPSWQSCKPFDLSHILVQLTMSKSLPCRV